MNVIQKIGLGSTFTGLVILMSILFVGNFSVKMDRIDPYITINQYQQLSSELEHLEHHLYDNAFQLSNEITTIFNNKNEQLKKAEKWNEVMWGSSQDFALTVLRNNSSNILIINNIYLFILTIGLIFLGGLLFIFSYLFYPKQSGRKFVNNVSESGFNRDAYGLILGLFLILFYIVLYWFPSYLINWILLVDPLSMALSGNQASQWFLYGLLYTLTIIVMGIRMLIKYRHNKYQLLRTGSVMFFQTSFAFLIPEILIRFDKPYMDFKNMWPLDYDFFFSWQLDTYLQNGTLGMFMLVWGVALFAVGVPIFTYFFGKRWYCSWVCGCGGLAETAGDAFRHLSSKTQKSWKIERISIYSVLVFTIVMTMATLYSRFSESYMFLGFETASIQKTYGFLIGSMFAGVIGTGFYPILGNRSWCRFGCPLAAYIGFVQRFKSRFRITTNGGQCISCGNCSTQCEMGIDVRAYAQLGENIVRESCVGCGVCADVCPRGVLKLENGPEQGRINNNPIIIGNDSISINLDSENY